MNELFAGIWALASKYFIEALAAIFILAIGGRYRKKLIREIKDEVVNSLAVKYVELDYPNAKPIHDIHQRIDELKDILSQIRRSNEAR